MYQGNNLWLCMPNDIAKLHKQPLKRVVSPHFNLFMAFIRDSNATRVVLDEPMTSS